MTDCTMYLTATDATPLQVLAHANAEQHGSRDLEDARLPSAASLQRVRIDYYQADDSVFSDSVYLVKGLAGRILWLVLMLHSTAGRSIFSNRELRRHPYLKLPPSKNNLEARLLLLQRRLDDKETAFRLCREQRGQVKFVCSAQLELNLQGIQPIL